MQSYHNQINRKRKVKLQRKNGKQHMIQRKGNGGRGGGSACLSVCLSVFLSFCLSVYLFPTHTTRYLRRRSISRSLRVFVNCREELTRSAVSLPIVHLYFRVRNWLGGATWIFFFLLFFFLFSYENVNVKKDVRVGAVTPCPCLSLD